MALIARRSFKYGSRSYSPGEVVPVRPSDRRALQAMKFVEQGEAAPVSAHELVMRSHLQYGYAQAAQAAAPEESPEEAEDAPVEAEPEAAKPKRKYNRRDMQADD